MKRIAILIRAESGLLEGLLAGLDIQSPENSVELIVMNTEIGRIDDDTRRRWALFDNRSGARISDHPANARRHGFVLDDFAGISSRLKRADLILPI